MILVFLNLYILEVFKNFNLKNFVFKFIFDKLKDLLDLMDFRVLISFDFMNDWFIFILILVFFFIFGLLKLY